MALVSKTVSTFPRHANAPIGERMRYAAFAITRPFREYLGTVRMAREFNGAMGKAAPEFMKRQEEVRKIASSLAPILVEDKMGGNKTLEIEASAQELRQKAEELRGFAESVGHNTKLRRMVGGEIKEFEECIQYTRKDVYDVIGYRLDNKRLAGRIRRANGEVFELAGWVSGIVSVLSGIVPVAIKMGHGSFAVPGLFGAVAALSFGLQHLNKKLKMLKKEFDYRAGGIFSELVKIRESKDFMEILGFVVDKPSLHFIMKAVERIESAKEASLVREIKTAEIEEAHFEEIK